MNRALIDLPNVLNAQDAIEAGQSWTSSLGAPSFVSKFATWFFWAAYYLVVWPWAVIYSHGPSFHGLGFWGGKSVSQICSEITGVEASAWVENAAAAAAAAGPYRTETPSPCARMVSQRANSFVWSVLMLFWIFGTFKLIGVLCGRARCQRPLRTTTTTTPNLNECQTRHK